MFSALMMRHTDLKPELDAYFNTSLAGFYANPAHRWLVYAAYFILSGLAAFGALWIYEVRYGYDLYNNIPLAFKGMYAWHTAANFALCLGLLDIFTAFVLNPWGAYGRRTVGKNGIIATGAFILGFIIQRTLVYRLVDLYHPKWILYHEIYPAERPGLFLMFLFMLPFWIGINIIIRSLILRIQNKSEELLRSCIDESLEKRATRPRKDAQKKVVDEPFSLPADSKVGDIDISQIGHVTVEDHYLRIHYHSNGRDKDPLVRMSLKEMSACLPSDQFLQIHRSHIVNLHWISGLKRMGRDVRLTMAYSRSDLPVSRYRLPRILPLLQKFLDRTQSKTITPL